MSCSSSDLRLLIDRVAQGECTPDEAYQQIQSQQAASSASTAVSESGDLRIDLQRLSRCGYPEVLYAPGKPDDALRTGFQRLIEQNQSCLATRCTPEQAKVLLDAFPEAISNELARTVRLMVPAEIKGRVGVVTAGTSDRPVAEEAIETLRWMNVHVESLVDVGVAGPQRWLNEKHRFAEIDSAVVVAGMEGALPSVVAGWLSCPVIAVPTSVGYGANLGGLSALLSMLNSCAANVAVVNIDAGFKGGYLAGMIAQRSASA